MRRMVWYASYGSSLCAGRLRCYLEGGRLTGAKRSCSGARDTSPPKASVTLSLPYRLYFAGTSKTWGGSPAFLDTERTESDATRARAYLIGWDQFEDLVAQENGRSVVPFGINEADMTLGFSRPVGSGRYENLLCVDHREGLPVVTLTAPWSTADVDPAAPSVGYLTMLVGGLREAYGLDDEEINRYLGSAPGCGVALARAALERFVSGITHGRH